MTRVDAAKSETSGSESGRLLTISDILLGIATTLLGGITLYFGAQFPVMQGDYFGPGTFPVILGLLLIIAGLWLFSTGMVRNSKTRNKEKRSWNSNLHSQAEIGSDINVADEIFGEGDINDGSYVRLREKWPDLLTVVLAIVVYLFIAPYLGFIVTSFIVLVSMMMRFGQRWISAIVVSAMLSLTLFYIFRSVLSVPLPIGFWR